nr:FecR family protein [uncultured Prevotella sp.]
MNKKNHTDIDNQVDINEQEDILLTHLEESTIRSALNRMDVEAPDVDVAWNQLKDKMVLDDVEESKSAIQWSMVWKVSISVAAIWVIAFVLVFDGRQDNAGRTLPVMAEQTQSSSSVQGKENEQAEKMEETLADEKCETEEMLSVETGKSKSQYLVLSDGTKVWLNAESQLIYPKNFLGKERKVTLLGEAYFEVRHDAKHPFVVETSRMIATDLGTAFDLKAYEGKATQLILISGSVAVQKRGETTSVVLKPDEMANLNGDKLEVSAIDSYPLVQWKNGLFYFHDTPLIEVMKELGRWYHIKVVFENKACLQTQIHFVAERSEDLKTVVKQLNEIEGVDVVLTQQELSVR